jgi:hypothetical protein
MYTHTHTRARARARTHTHTHIYMYTIVEIDRHRISVILSPFFSQRDMQRDLFVQLEFNNFIRNNDNITLHCNKY